MCGIAGIIYGGRSEETRAVVERMLTEQIHRGPDDGGAAVIETREGCVGLGNRRLAILDLSPLGRQPMENPETGDVLVYNGEIYNSPELRRELEVLGYSFRGRSDTEVLLRAYEEWGTRCLERLNGMYAFAMWDAALRRLVLARDGMGIKPLYWGRIARGGVVFASEVRAAMASGEIEERLDLRAVAGYLAYGAVQEPLTIIEGLAMLQAGCWMEVAENGEVRGTRKYWHLPEPDGTGRRATELAEEGKQLFERSVGRHLLSDVPVGVFLSSGLDSTAVLGAAAARQGGEVHAFTISFPEWQGGGDEAPVARATAARVGGHYHETAVDSRTATEWAERALNAMDQPTMDGVNTYMVSRAVRAQGIVVALSGQGGDEVFGGYSRTFRDVPRWQRQMGLLRMMPSGARESLTGWMAAGRGWVAREKARGLARAGARIEALYFQSRRLLSDGEIGDLGLHRAELGLNEDFLTPNWVGEPKAVKRDAVGTVRRLESVYYLGNTLLRDGDVFGMANSLEIRVPMLDKDLVEWAARIPGDTLLPPGRPMKHVLREMCRGYYNDQQLSRPKVGFTAPFGLWMRGPLHGLMDSSLETLKGSSMFTRQGIDRIRDTFLREPESAAWSRAWALLSLGHWMESRRR